MACLLIFFDWLAEHLSSLPPYPLTSSSHASLLKQTNSSRVYLTARTGPLRIIKVLTDVSLAEQESLFHREIELAFFSVAGELSGNGIEPHIPYIPQWFAFYPKLRDSQYAGMFRGLEGTPENLCGIAAEYIRPLTKVHVQSLLKRHLSITAPSISYEHFLIKVFMGDTKPLSYGSTTDFSNCAAYSDYLRSECVNPQIIATTMGNALAILHWRCGIDAAGVKFVFGRNNRGDVQLWLTDFGKCKRFQLSPTAIVIQLIDAILNNEPYWPRYIDLPEMRLAWTNFQNAYLKMSNLLLEQINRDSGLRLLPGIFMDELERIWGPKGVL